METSEIPQVSTPSIGVEFVRFRVKAKVQKAENVENSMPATCADQSGSSEEGITESQRKFTYHARSLLATKVALVPGISIACGTWKFEININTKEAGSQDV